MLTVLKFFFIVLSRNGNNLQPERVNLGLKRILQFVYSEKMEQKYN